MQEHLLRLNGDLKNPRRAFFARTPFSRPNREEKENGGWVGIKNKGLKPQDVASLASAGAFTATKRRFKKSKEGFFNKKIKV